MVSNLDAVRAWLEQWCPMGFAVGGIGFLISFVLVVANAVTAVTVPEVVVSVVVVPTLLVLSLVGLPGFYPYVVDGSPRLALGGLLAATVAGASIGVTTVGKVALHLLGVVGWTDEGPLLVGFFLFLIAFFVSMLLYGLAGTWSGEPSRVVGLLLLAIVVEPATTLLNDLFGLDLGIGILFGTLAVTGAALLAIGYFLRTESAPGRRSDPAPEAA